MNEAPFRSTSRTSSRRAGRPRAARDGNSLVLVSALLVLLVIVATAYLGRTRSERVLATAQQQAALRDDRASAVADDLAREVAEALFVRPINKGAVPPISTGTLANSNLPRLPIAPDSVRHGVDTRNTALAGSPAVLGYEYNFAPYHVVPFTNWPDNAAYPRGPLNLGGVVGILGESNPVGNPGYGDARWLRDVEPVRIRLDPTLVGLDEADELYVYSHWRKLSYIARPENGWRMVADISNALDSVITNLNVPVEQWLPFAYPGTIGGSPFGNQPGQLQPNNSSAAFFTNLGTRRVVDPLSFENQWGLWINSHPTSYRNLNFIPNNFYRLSDLNANGTFNEIGERPEDEFNGPGTIAGGPTGTARWSVSRTLADTDGDGYTDALWFLAPTMVEGGLRQVVAVSIVDNGGLVNVNTATRFVRNDAVTGIVGSRTTGLAPSDTALIAQNTFNNFVDPLNNWNVGFFDSFLNQSPANGRFFRGTQVRFRPEMWSTYQTSPPTRELNFLAGLNVKGNLAFPDLLGTQLERVRYFRSLAARFDDPSEGLTPFGIGDEIELRMFRASNNAETLSRLERAIDTRVYDPVGAGFVGPGNQQVFLRSDDFLEESSDWFDRLSVPDLVRDNRWKTTTYSATRNDLMPPWLWPSGHPDDPQIRYDVIAGNLVLDLPPAAGPALEDWRGFWQRRIRKVDLRREPLLGFTPAEDTNDFIETISDALTRALAATRPNPNTPSVYVGASYFGDFEGGIGGPDPVAFKRTRKMVESFAANIVAARDPSDNPLPVDFLVNFRPDVVDGPGYAGRRHPGMERHPFLVEAFVGHVYPVFTVPEPYPNSGERAVFSTEPGSPATDLSTTVVVVQIANPFDRSLPLRNLPETAVNEELLTPQFELEIFGQAVPLRNLALVNPPLAPPIDRLLPTTDDQPNVITLYAVVDDFDGVADFRTRWLDFLDIPSTQPDARVLPWARAVNLGDVPGATVSLSRGVYDTFTGSAVQIVRIEGPHRLVVDRIDRLDQPGSFGERVRTMAAQTPPAGPSDLPPDDQPFPIPSGWQLTSGLDGNQWVQWRRAARAFGFGRSATRFNPRYVYANRAISQPEDFQPVGAITANFFRNGNIYRVESEPDSPWFAHRRNHFEIAAQATLSQFARKPATFNLRWGEVFYSAEIDAAVVGDPDVYFPDTGVYHSPYALQMLQRNRDFERLGELGWVWLWGPEMDISNPASPVIERTFAEIMSAQANDYPTAVVGEDESINRLRLEVKDNFSGATVGTGDDVIRPRAGGVAVDASIPALPAWARVFDAFTLDGAGLNPADLDGNGTISPEEAEASRLRLAAGFVGRPVHGLLNVNTAPPEALRAMPHMQRLVDEGIGSFSLNPRVRWGDGIVAYRDRAGDWEPDEAAPLFGELPPYGGRGEFAGGTIDDGYAPQVRAERGIAGIGELLLADARPPDSTINALVRDSWRRGFAGLGPFGAGVSTQISTDTYNRFRPTDPNDLSIGVFEPDLVAGDLEERTLLFTGIGNLVTTRSDTFTVYFRIRTFRQDPVTGRWDALNRDNIVDDSRYVMVVDRSQVNSPSDAPKVLFLEKMPD